MVVVAEEGVQAGAVDKYVVRVQDAQSPGGRTVSGHATAGGAEIRIVDRRVDAEGRHGCRIRLVVPVRRRISVSDGVYTTDRVHVARVDT